MSELNYMVEVDSKNEIDLIIESEHNRQNPFKNLQKEPCNFYHQSFYVDDQFKLPQIRNNPNIVIRRLAEIVAPETSLFVDLKTGLDNRKITKNKICPSKPFYLAEFNMLPFSHYQNLVEPLHINSKGFYYVVMYKNGEMHKQIIDDTVYFDQRLQKIVGHPFLENHPWIHLILKAYAKKSKGYEFLDSQDGFDFMKTFSFPDWSIMNPNKHKARELIKKLSQVSHGFETMIARTKNNPNVGSYGFTANCASYFVTGYCQEYAQVFVKMIPMVHESWNFVFIDEPVHPEESPVLIENQFIIPLAEFNNIFHLLYSCNQKYLRVLFPKKINSNASIENSMLPYIGFEKFSINIDARDTKAIVLEMNVQAESKEVKQVKVGISIYFPFIKKFDLVHNHHNRHPPSHAVIPWCKLIVGQHVQNLHNDSSYVESIRSKMMDYGDIPYNFVSLNPSYEFIGGEYFKGYAHEMVQNFCLKPGKYFVRLKSEQKQAEYRCSFNATSVDGSVKVSDAKMGKKEQGVLMKDCILSKARKEDKFITYLNPIKKASWVCCRNEFDTLGYGYFVLQTIKHNEYKIAAHISPKKLKEGGYLIKGRKDMMDYAVEVDNEESAIIILKQDKEWKNESARVWPPLGIELTKIAKK